MRMFILSFCYSRSFRRSSNMSCRSKLLTYVTLLLQLGTSILAITAMVTNYWGVVPSESIHFGLTSYCDKYEKCTSGTLIGAGKEVTPFIFSILVLLGNCLDSLPNKYE